MLMQQLIFVYIIPVITTILALLLIIIWAFLTPTGKILLKKRLGLLRGAKGFGLIGWDDRILQLEDMTVSPEGAMEKKKKKIGSLTFYLAKPQDDTLNTDENLRNERRDRDILPPYYLDGVLPVYLGHVSKAIATNPKALMALRYANFMDLTEKDHRTFKAEGLLPAEVKYPDEFGNVTKTKTVPVNVILPFDPVDIKRNFPSYWQQANIDATKKRHQNIGAEKEKQSNRDFFKLMIVGAIVACVMIGGVLVAGKVFGA